MASLPDDQVAVPKKTRQPKQVDTAKQPRRLWTPREEDALLRCMLECYSDTYKADNGFKPGFYVIVEKALQRVLPGTNLRAKPNIESKVKHWKKLHAIISEIKKISGFGWNYELSCFEVDDTVWAAYEKDNSAAKGLNGKPFPMFESWQTLFGKDRATGELAEDAADLDDVTPIDTPASDIGFEDCYTPTFANGDPAFGFEAYANIGTPPSATGTPTSNANGIPPTNATPTAAATGTPNVTAAANAAANAFANAQVGPNKPSKRARLDAKEKGIADALGSYMTQSNAVLERIAKGVGYDQDMAEKSRNVFNMLLNLDIGDVDRYRVNSIIVSKDKRVNEFYGLPDDRKQGYVDLILQGLLYPQ